MSFHQWCLTSDLALFFTQFLNINHELPRTRINIITIIRHVSLGHAFRLLVDYYYCRLIIITNLSVLILNIIYYYYRLIFTTSPAYCFD